MTGRPCPRLQLRGSAGFSPASLPVRGDEGARTKELAKSRTTAWKIYSCDTLKVNCGSGAESTDALQVVEITMVKERKMAAMIPQDLLEILVCPACKKPLVIKDNGESLKCNACRRVYPVREDIPILLVDEAVTDPS